MSALEDIDFEKCSLRKLKMLRKKLKKDFKDSESAWIINQMRVLDKMIKKKQQETHLTIQIESSKRFHEMIRTIPK